MKLTKFVGNGWEGQPVLRLNVFGHNVAQFELKFYDSDPSPEYELFCECEFKQAADGSLVFQGYKPCRLKKFGAHMLGPALAMKMLFRPITHLQR